MRPHISLYQGLPRRTRSTALSVIAGALFLLVLMVLCPVATPIRKAQAATGPVLLCSSSADGVPGNGSNYAQSNTPDGRYVVFESEPRTWWPGTGTAKGISFART